MKLYNHKHKKRQIAPGMRDTSFYSSKKWKDVRDYVKRRDRMICQNCGKVITGRYIVDHITPVTHDNYRDWKIAYNPDNLQLLCQSCHNKKTQRDINPTRGYIKRFNLW